MNKHRGSPVAKEEYREPCLKNESCKARLVAFGPGTPDIGYPQKVLFLRAVGITSTWITSSCWCIQYLCSLPPTGDFNSHDPSPNLYPSH